MANPSLPPGIDGETLGSLIITIQEVSWLKTPYEVLFRLKFWGEETFGILLSSSATFLTYDIKTNFVSFLRYLTDTNILIIDVLNPAGQLIGQIKVFLKSLSKSKNNINFKGKFPIQFFDTGKVGFIVFGMKSKMNRKEEEILSSFQQHEINTLKETNADKDNVKANPKKIFVPRSSLNRIPKPKIVKNEPNNEIIKKLEEKTTPTFQFTNEDRRHVSPEKKNKESESKNSEEKINFKDFDLEAWEQWKLKLKILTFTLFSNENYPFVYIECILYQNIYAETSVPDSFQIFSYNKQSKTYYFSHESAHNCKIPENPEFFIKNYKILFTAKVESSSLLSIIGAAEIPWKELLISDVKERITLPMTLNSIEIGELSIEKLIKKPEIMPVIQETPSVNILYLYIEKLDRIEKTPNLFISYKTIPDLQKITTNVFWNYSNSEICHKMMMPCPDFIRKKLSESVFVLEIWEKKPENDEIIGITKVNLKAFNAEVLQSLMPVVAVDEFLPIVNLLKGKEVGYIKACLAFGTPAQVQRLSGTHKNLQNLSPKLQKSEINRKIENTLNTSEKLRFSDKKTETVEKLWSKPEFSEKATETVYKTDTKLEKNVNTSFDNFEDLAEALNPKVLNINEKNVKNDEKNKFSQFKSNKIESVLKGNEGFVEKDDKTDFELDEKDLWNSQNIMIQLFIEDIDGDIRNCDNLYVKFKWFDREIRRTPPNFRNFACFLELFPRKQHESIFFEVWQRNLDVDDEKLGC